MFQESGLYSQANGAVKVSINGYDVTIDLHANNIKFDVLDGQRFRISSLHITYHCEAEKHSRLEVPQRGYAFCFNFSEN